MTINEVVEICTTMIAFDADEKFKKLQPIIYLNVNG